MSPPRPAATTSAAGGSRGPLRARPRGEGSSHSFSRPIPIWDEMQCCRTFTCHGHGSFEPPIGQELICFQETKCIAMLYDTHRFQKMYMGTLGYNIQILHLKMSYLKYFSVTFGCCNLEFSFRIFRILEF